MRLTILTIFFILSKFVHAQQEVLYTQYMFNALALNPGYAGNKDAMNINLTYRNQWTQLEGAPKTMLLSIEKGIPNKNLGLGFHIVSDQLGAQKQISPFLSAAFRIQISSGTVLSSGIAIGFTQYQLDGTLLRPGSGSDPAISAKLNSTLLMDAKFGLYLNSDHFYLGLSAANLFNNQVNYSGDQTNIIVPQRLHFFLMSGYVFSPSDIMKCYPSILVRENFNQPTSVDLNALVFFYDRLGIGGSYRTAFSLFTKSNLQKDLTQRAAASGIIQLYPGNGMRIGYSYDFTLGGQNSYFGGSHEISIGFAVAGLQKGIRILSPRFY